MAKKAEKTEKTVAMFQIKVLNGENEVETAEVKSVCAMWKKVKELFAKNGGVLFAKNGGVRILVSDPEGKPFKDLHLVAKANGKAWMVNDVKETNRKPKAKSEKTETVAETEEPKAEAEEVAEAI